jgi:hypothetical protein
MKEVSEGNPYIGKNVCDGGGNVFLYSIEHSNKDPYTEGWTGMVLVNMKV